MTEMMCLCDVLLTSQRDRFDVMTSKQRLFNVDMTLYLYLAFVNEMYNKRQKRRLEANKTSFSR